MLTLGQAIAASFAIALVIFSERLFPFALFSKKDPPALISFIERYIPSMIMAILVIYGFKDVAFSVAPYGIPYILGIAAAVVLHLWLKNPMISIFGSTIIYMILSHLM